VWNALSSRRRKRLARVPQGTRVYAVGDVHGRADLLAQLFSEIDADLKAHPAPRAIHVFLGDYIDRGPDSRQVLDLLVARSQSHETIFLKGNHEVLLEEFFWKPEGFATCRDVGGVDTLLSYGIRPPSSPDAPERMTLARRLAEVLPPAHRQFLRSLKHSVAETFSLFMQACGPAFLCHNRRTKTCSGSGTNFSIAERDSERLSYTGIIRSWMWNFIPTASISIPAPL
jgi:serine/threonine protein phosphatase 1